MDFLFSSSSSSPSSSSFLFSFTPPTFGDTKTTSPHPTPPPPLPPPSPLHQLLDEDSCRLLCCHPLLSYKNSLWSQGIELMPQDHETYLLTICTTDDILKQWRNLSHCLIMPETLVQRKVTMTGWHWHQSPGCHLCHYFELEVQVSLMQNCGEHRESNTWCKLIRLVSLHFELQRDTLPMFANFFHHWSLCQMSEWFDSRLD